MVDPCRALTFPHACEHAGGDRLGRRCLSSEFFDDLARELAWVEGRQEWEAEEGGLGLFCTGDRLGHITVTVELREGPPERWLVRGDVPLDAGQLELGAGDAWVLSYRDGR